jgi:XTP/dITP diphosphohydrolase
MCNLEKMEKIIALDSKIYAMRLLLATTNQGKLHELRALLSNLPSAVELVTPLDLHLYLSVDETADTYAGNAEIKASAFCSASELTTLADDSGLEVPALNGAPGLHSARYAPHPEADDLDRRTLLIKNLLDFPRPWNAQFRSVVAIARVRKPTLFYEGVCQGEIIPVEKGMNGFGYDPIFLLPGLGKTMAELEMDEKNMLSHRAMAIRAVINDISSWTGD